MRSRREPLDLNNRWLGAGEKLQDFRDRRWPVLSGLVGIVEDLIAPNLDNFERARWTRLYREDPPWRHWPHVSGDTEAGILPRSKKTAVVLGIAHTAMEELREDMKAHPTIPAVAYRFRGVTHAGLMPVDFSVIEDMEVISMLIGRGDFEPNFGVAGLPNPEHQDLLRVRRKDFAKKGAIHLPDAEPEVLDVMPAKNLQEKYPGISVV